MNIKYDKDIKRCMFKASFFNIKKLLQYIGLYKKQSLYYFNFNEIKAGDIIRIGSGWGKDGYPIIYFLDQWDLKYEHGIDINPFHKLLKHCENNGRTINSKSYNEGNGIWITYSKIIETNVAIRDNKLNSIGI